MASSASAGASISPSDLLSTAMEHARAGRFRQAEELYRRVLRDDPDHAGALHGLGFIALAVSKPELAAAYLAQAAEKSPDNSQFKFDLGEAWARIGDWNQAAACYRRAIALDPAKPEAHAGLGFALARTSRFAEAVQSLATSIEHGNKDPETHRWLSHALLQLGRFAEAEAAARKAVEVAPSSFQAWQTLGEAIGNQKRADQAMECFRRAISLKADWPLPHYAMGITLGRAGRVPEAIESLRTALRLRPEFPEAVSNLGTMLVDQRKMDEAIQTLRKAVELRPTHLDSHIELARALEIAHKPQEAAQAFSRILHLAPDNQNVMFHMAALSGKDPPPTAPPLLVTALFNRHADTFDQHLVQHLEYRVPQLIRSALDEVHLGNGLDVLDLGCGTGLCGQLLRPFARTLSGVDLSKAMVEKAKERGVYDRLEVGEIVQTLKASPEAYDLLVAGDVLCYVGDLSEVFASATNALRPGGFFVFSVELHESTGWALRPSRRYAHSREYICMTARQYDLGMISLATNVLRKEAGQDLRGLVAILRRSGLCNGNA